MAFLEYIADEDILALVENVLRIGFDKKETVSKDFNKNVIDPFATIFDAAISGFNHDNWKEAEMVRQCQKTLTNHIGNLHQEVLGCVDGWDDLKKGFEVDLISREHKVIAEIKNKHNTLTGGRLADEYHSLNNIISKKASNYFGYTAYFVNIIPSRPQRFDKPFIPSDRSIGSTVMENPNIRTMDGASFYTLVTGREFALKEFFTALPYIIEKVMIERLHLTNAVVADKDIFANYYKLAFGE